MENINFNFNLLGDIQLFWMNKTECKLTIITLQFHLLKDLEVSMRWNASEHARDPAEPELKRIAHQSHGSNSWKFKQKPMN